MDDLDLTEQSPRSFETTPIPYEDLSEPEPTWAPAIVAPVTPLSPARAALGTKTGIPAISRTPTIPPPIPTAAMRAKRLDAAQGIDVDFAEESATTEHMPNKDPEPAWLSRFTPPASTSEPAPWQADRPRTHGEEPLSWTAPIEKEDLIPMPSAASPIAAIVAHAEAEAAAAIAAATGTKKLAPAPAAEPARPRTRTATISVPPPLPTPARAARASVPPPLSSTMMAAAPPPPRAPSPNIVIADELASAEPVFSPAADDMFAPAADAREEMFAATAPSLPAPAPALPALPRPSQNWMRANTSAHAQAHAELPLAAQTVDLFAEPAPIVDEDDDALLVASQARSPLKTGLLLGGAAALAAGIVFVIVRAASPASPDTIATPAPIAAPIAVAAPAPVAAPTAAPVATPAPVAVAAAVPAPVAAPVAAPAPVAVATAAPAPAETAPTPQPTLANIPITTNPSGATITLVANGEATVLGPTPLFASLDPTKSYDIVIASRGQQTRMQHIAPNTQQVAIDLTAHHAPAPAPTAPAAPVAPAHHAIATSAPAPVAPAVHHTAPAPAPAAPHAAKPAVIGAIPANAGVMMISSKPPCEILIDGKSTHLMTPQSRLVLQPGPHTITLVNPAQHIQNSTKVEILAGLPSRMIKDFTH